jgi:ABC-2 type transport system permease protein
MSHDRVQPLAAAGGTASPASFLALDPFARGSGPESPFPRARVVRAYLTEARYELLRSLRMPAFALPFLLLPGALYLFFTVLLFGKAVQGHPGLAIGSFVAWGTFGVMGPGLFGFGVFVAMEREQGLLTLKRAQPMPPAAYLFAKTAMCLLFSALILVTLIAAALLVAHPPLSFGRMLGVAATLGLGALPFCALGLFLGTRVSGKAAPAFANLAYLPMLYLSGLFFPLNEGMQKIALVSPAFHLNQLALGVAGLPALGSALGHVVFLGLWTLVFGGLAVRRLGR